MHLAILEQLLPKGMEAESALMIYESIEPDIHKPRAPNDKFFGLNKKYESPPPFKSEENDRSAFIDQVKSLFNDYNLNNSKFLGGLFSTGRHDPAFVDECSNHLQKLVKEGEILMAFIEIQHESIKSKKIRDSKEGYLTKLVTQDEFSGILTKLYTNLAMIYPLFESLAQPFFEHLVKYPEMTMEIGRQIQQLIFKNDLNTLSNKFQELQQQPKCRPETREFYKSLDQAVQKYQKAIATTEKNIQTPK